MWFVTYYYNMVLFIEEGYSSACAEIKILNVTVFWYLHVSRGLAEIVLQVMNIHCIPLLSIIVKGECFPMI